VIAEYSQRSDHTWKLIKASPNDTVVDNKRNPTTTTKKTRKKCYLQDTSLADWEEQMVDIHL